ncbi:hypothetical protein CAXC1_80057 [Candidatus Xenohaliotis californiensis]|uniref:Uncharacterized protein n=1 Tax=Candidatus Xenohaliotis californiensis TaxID=84677 RepID=A0ABP0EVI9_9RICK|nr:hypothetical protein CAXC1_80057 [Candidatus Xenohaliotis californiensis]
MKIKILSKIAHLLLFSNTNTNIPPSKMFSDFHNFTIKHGNEEEDVQ